MAYNDLVSSPRCQHVHFSGKACKAPARRNRPYCLFHESAHLPVGDRPVLPVPEDEHAFAIAVTRVLRALTEGDMEPRRAAVVLYGLQLTSGNLKRLIHSRADIEDPDAALSRNILARYFVHRHRAVVDGRKDPEPTELEAQEIIAAAAKELAASRPDPDALTPDPAIRLADEEREQLLAAERILARARAGESPYAVTSTNDSELGVQPGSGSEDQSCLRHEEPIGGGGTRQ